MPEHNKQRATEREPMKTRARRLGIAILFSTILLIPRIRRLRRRPRAWLIARLVLGIGGAALIWRVARSDAGLGSLILGVVLVAFGALVRARPEKKSVDDVARELEALVVVNGGDFSAAGSSHRNVSIYVKPERLVVLTRAFEPLAEIPLASLRQISTEPVGANGHRSAGAWEVRLDWEAEGTQAARFHYHGTFAEHLARVAGQTITSVWKKSLPVLRS